MLGQDIICLCHSLSLGRDLLEELHTQAQEVATHPLTDLPLVRPVIPRKEKGQRGGVYWSYSWKVWGFSLAPVEELCPGYLQKPEQPAFHLLLFLGSC